MSTTARMTVAGLSIDNTTRTPVLLLREEGGELVLPIYIGLMEASAIAAQLESVSLARPMTHDLLKSLLVTLGGKLLRVEVTDLRDNTFFASLFVQQGDRVVEIDSRPSDAIALALRTGADICVSRHVLALSGARPSSPVGADDGAVGASGDDEASDETEAGGAPDEAALEREVPEEDPTPRVLYVPESARQGDAEQWREILEKLDPEDFGKYKM